MQSDSIEKDKRIRVIMELILEDYPASDIVRHAETTWGVSDRQARRYLRDARKRWQQNDQELIEHKRRLKIESLKKLKRSLSGQYKGTPAGIRAVMSVEKQIIKLEQLDPATRIELSGPDGQPIQAENQTVVLYLPQNGRKDEKGD